MPGSYTVRGEGEGSSGSTLEPSPAESVSVSINGQVREVAIPNSLNKESNSSWRGGSQA